MSTANKEADDSTDSSNDNELVNVTDIDEANEWVNLEAEVDQLWEPSSDSIAQVGLLRDDSGVLKFVAWQTSDVPEMEEGEAYSIENVVTDEYEGDFSVNLNSATDVEALDDDSVISEDGDNDGGNNNDESDNSNELVTCDDVDSDGEWVDIEAEVDQLWEPNTDSIAQVGLLSDDDETLKFTSWTKSELPEVEEDQTYRFSNVVTNEYDGSYSVNLNSNTSIEQIE